MQAMPVDEQAMSYWNPPHVASNGYPRRVAQLCRKIVQWEKELRFCRRELQHWMLKTKKLGFDII